MPTLAANTLSGPETVGAEVTAQHLGANFLFNRVDLGEGVGTGGYDETADSFGISHFRYPGGTMAERQFDPASPDNTYQPTDLLTGEPIANADRHTLTPMSEFLAYAADVGAKVTIVIPTARYLPALEAGGAAAQAIYDEIATFVEEALDGPNGHVIEAFEIGNEFAALGLTPAEYGQIADHLAVAIDDGIAAANPAEPPLIALQASARSARPQETAEILDQMSPAAQAAVDALVIHNYRPFPWDDADVTAGKFDHVTTAERILGRDLDVLVTEWNVANGSSADGLLQGAGILEMFDQMLRLGVDRAHIWPVLENNTTRLAADVVEEGEPADPMIGGAIYHQMVQSLPGTTALNVESRLDVDGDGTVDFLLHSYGGDGEGMVLFVSSLESTAQSVTLDLSALSGRIGDESYLWLTQTGVADGVDPTSPNALPVVSAVSLGHSTASETVTLELGAYEIARLEFSGDALGVTVFEDTAEIDDFRLSSGADVVVLGSDGGRDRVRNFDPVLDRLDVSALGLTRFEDLRIRELLRSDGSVNWLEIADADGRVIMILRTLPDVPLTADSLDAEHFIFATDGVALPPGLRVIDEAGFDDMRATDAAEVFRLADDGTRDLIRNFDVTTDFLYVSAWGVTGIDELTIGAQTRRDGSVSWITVTDAEGQTEVAIRYDAGQALDPALLTTDRFVFAPPGTAELAPVEMLDQPGFTDLRGQIGAERYVMLDDGDRDIIRSFQPGIDQIDVSDWGLSSAEDLTLRNQLRKDGSINWIQVVDPTGEIEFLLRLDGVATDAANFSTDDLIF